ncbi:MAG: class II fructose-1,6-bisphosphate aldolase [Pseudomonadota bacterium]|nr:class II fructose-1,6-bisphosphate aldolase [Pseudomonadota bacterium]
MTNRLVSTHAMFADALAGRYAIGAFNVNNMEILQAVVDAAEQSRSPLIVQASESAIKYARTPWLLKMIEAALETTTIPIALHLDHGGAPEICKTCIDAGFSSVMIDASGYPFEENVAMVREVVNYAKPRGISVEAELGKLAGVEDSVNVSAKDATYTNAEEAAIFVERTGCDSLAIAIGTSHGAYKFKGDAQLDFERLAEIRAAIGADFPLVLHGASSVPEELVMLANRYGANLPDAKGVPASMLSQATKNGIAKVNMDTDLRLAMTASIRKVFAEKPSEFDPRKYMGPGRDAITDLVKTKMKLLGSANSIA